MTKLEPLHPSMSNPKIRVPRAASAGGGETAAAAEQRRSITRHTALADVHMAGRIYPGVGVSHALTAGGTARCTRVRSTLAAATNSDRQTSYPEANTDR